MDMSNGPEPCVVCGDAATGYHYRCMTCEGCKVSTYYYEAQFVMRLLQVSRLHYDNPFPDLRADIMTETKAMNLWIMDLVTISEMMRNQSFY